MNKSFTLIEILVVIVIIGIISAFIIVGMSSVSSKATIAKGQVFASSLKNSLLLNLISEWKLDGNANDLWGVNNGTILGATLTSSNCVKGSCYVFDGNDSIDLGTDMSLNITSKITLEGWIKPNSFSGSNQVIITKTTNPHADPWRMYAILINGNSSDPRARFTLSTGVVGSQTNLLGNTRLSANNWYYIVGTWNGSLMKIYLNGIDDYPVGLAFSSTIGSSDTNYIGSAYGGDYVVGSLDEIRIYNESMSSSLIQENYYSGLNRLLVHNEFDVTEYGWRLGELRFNVIHND